MASMASIRSPQSTGCPVHVPVRAGADGGFMWPGFGENVRILEWILNRCEVKDDQHAVKSAVGWVPAKDSIRLDGLKCKVDMEGLFSTPKSFWQAEVDELRNYFLTQVGDSLPQEIMKQLDQLKTRVDALES